jgi:hypothetical protein
VLDFCLRYKHHRRIIPLLELTLILLNCSHQKRRWYELASVYKIQAFELSLRVWFYGVVNLNHVSDINTTADISIECTQSVPNTDIGVDEYSLV